MTADIRTAAQREARRIADETNDVTKQGLEWEWGYVDGYVAAVSRAPSRDDIADVIESADMDWQFKFDLYRSGAGSNPGPKADYVADEILALMQELAEGEC